MRIIEIKALENGAHRNQNGFIGDIPDGWAVIPDNIETQNFPFGDIDVEEIDVFMTVTRWVPGIIPSQEPSVILNKTKQSKLVEISKSCEDYIYAGTNVTLPDNTTQHFTYTLADQSNIDRHRIIFTAVSSSYIATRGNLCGSH